MRAYVKEEKNRGKFWFFPLWKWQLLLLLYSNPSNILLSCIDIKTIYKKKKYIKMTTEDTSPIEVQRNTAKERRKEWRVRTSISRYWLMWYILFIRSFFFYIIHICYRYSIHLEKYVRSNIFSRRSSKQWWIEYVY